MTVLDRLLEHAAELLEDEAGILMASHMIDGTPWAEPEWPDSELCDPGQARELYQDMTTTAERLRVAAGRIRSLSTALAQHAEHEPGDAR